MSGQSRAARGQESFRVSQRRPQACVACSKKKVKCDKQLPCARCTKAGTACYRERIQVSKALSRDRNEIDFLKQLRVDLRNDDYDGPATRSVTRRIAYLAHGDESFDDSSSPEPNNADRDRNTDAVGLVDQPEHTHSQCASQDSTLTDLVPTQILESLSQQGGHQDLYFSGTMPNRITLASPRNSLPIQKTHQQQPSSWAKNYAACYPHRACECRAQRSISEITSINSDLSNTHWLLGDLHAIAALLPSIADSRKLVQFHLDYILWHHNSIHGPTFLRQCEKFWESGCCDHPLWIALYLCVLLTAIWCAQNSIGAQLALGLVFGEQEAPGLYAAMIDILYKERFMENFSLYSIQAIIISTRASNNLGHATSTAILLSAATRIAHYMGLHKISDQGSNGLTLADQWYEKVEKETGKRVWWQLVNQDYLSIHYTDTYIIAPGQYSTMPPLNCDNNDLIEQPHGIPTISSYTIMMSKIALLLARLVDDLRPMQGKPLADQYQHVLQAERDLRYLLRDIPMYLLREALPDEYLPTWVNVARRTIAMSAADKVIMIHRSFLFLSFRSNTYLHTRRTCVAAAKTILRYHENNTDKDDISVWTHSAFCITAANVLGLELYHIDADDENINTYRSILIRAQMRLLQRRGDILSQRSAKLIDSILRFDKQRAQSREMQHAADLFDSHFQQFSYDEFDFNQTMANFNAMDQWADVVGLDQSPYTIQEPEETSSLVSGDFEPWFSQAFGSF